MMGLRLMCGIVQSGLQGYKDSFFYVCDGGLCFDYIKECEEKYRTNVTEAIEE